MQYHGFSSLSAYESECARLGFTTRRVPFTGPAGECFALVTAPPNHPTGSSVESWALFPLDESTQLLDGVINDRDESYLSKLAAHGYFPDSPQAAPAPSEPEYPVGDGGQICFPF